jgi:deoxyxylulose-5-phosphate synthase
MDHKSPDDVVRHFTKEVTQETKSAVREELCEFMNRNMTETEFRVAIFEDLGCAYYYPSEWDSARSWLQHLSKLLRCEE